MKMCKFTQTGLAEGLPIYFNPLSIRTIFKAGSVKVVCDNGIIYAIEETLSEAVAIWEGAINSNE